MQGLCTLFLRCSASTQHPGGWHWGHSGVHLLLSSRGVPWAPWQCLQGQCGAMQCRRTWVLAGHFAFRTFQGCLVPGPDFSLMCLDDPFSSMIVIPPWGPLCWREAVKYFFPWQKHQQLVGQCGKAANSSQIVLGGIVPRWPDCSQQFLV